jgi:two-component system response regulator PilR (NtrC family)
VRELENILEREAILQALGKTGFNRTAAARLLGITFRQLRYRMQRLNIKDENR